MYTPTALLLDLAVVAVIVLFIALGAHKGFVLTLCSLVAVLVAMIGANIVADMVAPMVADFLQPRLELAITEQLTEALKHTDFIGADGGAAASASEIPLPAVLDFLRESELYQGVMDSVEKALSQGAADAAASAAARVAAAIAQQLARGVIFLAAFLILLILWWIVSHALDLVAKLPVLDQLNYTLGGVLGFVKGLIIAYIAVWVLYDLIGYVTPQMAEGSRLFSLLASHSPLELLQLM